MELAKWEEVVVLWMCGKSFELEENDSGIGLPKERPEWQITDLEDIIEERVDSQERKNKFEKKTGVNLDHYYKLLVTKKSGEKCKLEMIEAHNKLKEKTGTGTGLFGTKFIKREKPSGCEGTSEKKKILVDY
ncbi:Hypothetical predicted protein [Paramuricea clavata]|uniref:Uncharacterized protein n=1 Tax=Paramuricea clavata TaxID=317549 RepID=A0A7D9LKW2_PARCT|nr:Hypothetical predicted protein [Paramuricea clavata]